MASKKKSFLQTISQNKAEAAKPKTEERKYFLQYMPEIQAIKQQNIENKKPVYQRFLDTYGKTDGAVENPATMSKTLETQIDQVTRLRGAKQEESDLNFKEAKAKSEGLSFDREEEKKTANMSIEEYEKYLLEQRQKSPEQVEKEKRQKLRQDAYREEMSNFEVERREKARKEELETLYSIDPNHPFLTEEDKLELEILRIKYPVTSEEIGSTRTGEIYDGDRVPLFVTDTVLENTELLESRKLDPASDAILKNAWANYESQMNADNKLSEAERIFGRVGLDSFPEERQKLENAYSEYSQGRITRAQYEAIVENIYNFAKSALPSIETAEMVAERRQTISNIKQEIEALEAIPNKTWNEEKRIADLYSLLAVYDNRLYRNPGEGGSGTFTKNPDEANLLSNWIEANAASGIANFAYGVVSTADFLIPTELFIDEEDDPFSIADESAKDLAQKVSEAAYQSARELGGGGWHTGGQLIATVVEMLPSIALSFGTGGASAASGSKMLNAGTMLNNGSKLANAGRRIVNGIKTVGKNPQFWMSVARELGPSYDEAIANGATNEEATYYALVTTALNSLIELGGIEALPQKVRGGGKPLLEFVKSVFNEGKEEVLQGIVSKAFAAMIYDEETKIYSETDENAIINPNRIKKEFTLGTAAAAILGSPTAIVNSVNNQISYADTGKSIKARGTESALISESLKAPETSDLYKAASKLANKKNISNVELGKLFYAYNDYVTKAKGIDYYDYEEKGVPVGEVDSKFDYKGGSYAEINSLIQNNEATSYIADRIMEIDNTVSREEAVDAVERAKARAFDQSVANSSMLDFEKSKAIEMYQLKEQALERMYNLGKQGLPFDYSMGAGLLSEVDAHQAYTRGVNAAGIQAPTQVKANTSKLDVALENAVENAPEAPIEKVSAEEFGEVQFENGKDEVQPKEVKYDAEQTNKVLDSLGIQGKSIYEAVTKQIIKDGTTGAELEAKKAGIAYVYETGLQGGKVQRSKANGLHIKHINAIYDAATKDKALKQTAKRKSNAKLIKDDTFKSTKTSKSVERTLEGIAKITGRDIRFSDTLEGNAKIDLKNGEIIISTKAVNGTAWAMIHEVYHAMEIDAPKEANILKKTVLDIMAKHPAKLEIMLKAYNATYRSEITDENGRLKVDAIEHLRGEMVADILGYIISDKQILSTITGKQRNVLQQFIDRITSRFGSHGLKNYINQYNERDRGAIKSLFKDVNKEADAIAEQFRAGLGAIGNTDKNGDYVSNVSETADGERFSRSITTEQDAEYLELAKDPEKNEARLREMVDEAARKAGYTTNVYHGTQKFGFTKPNVKKSDDGISFFATKDFDVAGTYSGVAVEHTRKVNTHTEKLSKNEVPKLRRQIKLAALEFSNEYYTTLGKYESWYMDILDYITNRDFSEIVSPNEFMQYATSAIDSISAMHQNVLQGRPGKKADFDLTEDVKQKLEDITEKYIKKISEIISPYYDSGVYGLYANTDNFLVIDAQGSKWNAIKYDGLPNKNEDWTTRDVATYAKQNGYDGVEFKNIVDPANYTVTHPATVYAFFKPQHQLKSADPVTYDNKGNIIPLSERFNPEKNDIRWSKELFPDDRTMSAEEIEQDEIEQMIQSIKSSDDLSDADVQAIRDELIQSAKQKRQDLINEILNTSLKRWGADVGRSDNVPKMSIEQAVKKVQESFGVKIASGGDASVSGKNAVSYNENTKTIRTKFKNDLPAVCHALGYHIDKELDVVNMIVEQTDEVRRVNGDGEGLWEQELKRLANLDGTDTRKAIKEGFAEFIRLYLVSKPMAQQSAGAFYSQFESMLSQNEELANAVETSAEVVHNYFAQSAEDRASSAIMTKKEWDDLNKGTIRERFKATQVKLHQAVVDTVYGIKATEKKYGVFDLTTSGSGYVKAALTRTSRARAARMLTDNFYDSNGNAVGESLFKIIAPLGKEKSEKFNAFGDYLAFVHALEWIEPNKVKGSKTSSGKDIYNAKAKGIVFNDATLNDANELRRIIANMESKYTDFKDIAKKVYKYQQNLMDYYLVPSGALSRDQAETFRAQYPHYVPFNRYNTVFGDATGGKNRSIFANLKNPIQKADGGNAPMRNPLESIINATYAAVDFFDKNTAMQTIASEFTGLNGIPGVMERIYSTEELEKLSEKGQNPFSIEETKILDESKETSFNPVADKDNGIVYVWVNGEKRFYQVYNKELFNSLSNLNVQELGKVFRFINGTNNALKRLMTVWNPIFATRNAIKDFQSFKNNSVTNQGVLGSLALYASSAISLITHDENYQLYKALGGMDTTRLTADEDAIKKAVKSGVRKNSKFVNVMNPKDFKARWNESKADAIKNAISFKDMNALWKYSKHEFFQKIDLIRNCVNLFFYANDFVETLPRLAEFKASMALPESKGDAKLAFYRSQDVTTDFARKGTQGRRINALFLFSNANIQGIDKAIRTYTEAKYTRKNKNGEFSNANIAKRIMSNLTFALMMTALVEFFNRRDEEDEEEYRRLSDFMKNNYYCFSTGDGEFIKIPKGENSLLPQTLIQRIFDATQGDDLDMVELGAYVWDSFFPEFIPNAVDAIGHKDPATLINAPLNKMPTSVISDVLLNRNYMGDEIIPEYMGVYENNFEKYTGNTSKFAVDFAKSLYDVTGIDVSPMSIDHLFGAGGWYGSFASRLMPSVSEEEHNVGEKLWDAFGLGRTFTTDARYSTDLLNDFYDKKDEVIGNANSKATAENLLLKEKYETLGSFISSFNKQSRNSGQQQQRLDRETLQIILEGFNPEELTEGEKYAMTLFDATGNKDVFNTTYPRPELKSTKTKKGKKTVTTASLDANTYAEFCKDISDMREFARVMVKGLGLDETTSTELLIKEYDSINESVKEKYLEKYGKSEETKVEKKEIKYDEKAYDKAFNAKLDELIF